MTDTDASQLHPAHLDLVSSSTASLTAWCDNDVVVLASDDVAVGVRYGDIVPDVALANLCDRLQVMGRHVHSTRPSPMDVMTRAGSLDVAAHRALLKRVRRACGAADSATTRAYEIGADYVISTSGYVLSHTPLASTGMSEATIIPVGVMDCIVAAESESVDIFTSPARAFALIDDVLYGARVPSSPGGTLVSFAAEFERQVGTDANPIEVKRTEFAKQLREIAPSVDDVAFVPDEFTGGLAFDAKLASNAIACLSSTKVELRHTTNAPVNILSIRSSVTATYIAARRR